MATETPSQLDKSNERVRKMFASIAHRYDMMNHVLSMNIDRTWRRKMTRLLPPGDTGPILDVCTGTGDLALEYWKAAHASVPIVGTDFCAEMLQYAREKSDRLGAADQITWLEADTQALPFPDDQFQLVVVAFGIRNVADTHAGLREMVRVCRPGGAIGILEFSMPHVQPFRSLYRWYFRYLLPFIGQRMAPNDEMAYDYLPSSVSEFPHGEAFADWMRSAGLLDVQCHPFTFGISTLYVGRKPDVTS